MPRTYAYREDGGRYECRLHRAPCVAPGCARTTVVRPMCAAHARRWLGVYLGRAGGRRRGGTGLFAARAFRRGDAVVPYLGRRVPRPATRGDCCCPHAVRCPPEGRDVGPYMCRIGRRWQIDASCHRSYGGMVNHAATRGAGRNAALRYATVRAVGEGRREASTPSPTRMSVDACDGGVRTVPAALLHAAEAGWAPDATGVGVPYAWVVATRDIGAGEEIRVDYGPAALAGFRGDHATVPPLR